MTLGLVRRAVKGSSLTAADHDGNMDKLEAAAFPDSVLVVRSVDDLPDAVSGNITLPAGKTVLLLDSIDIGSDYITLSTGTLLRGLGGQVIQSSNTGGVVRCSGLTTDVVLREFLVVATGGPCFDLSGPIDQQLNMFFVGMFGAGAGTITGFDVQAVRGCFIDAASGLRLAGTSNKIFVQDTPFYSITDAAITLDASLDAKVADIVTNYFKYDSPGVAVKAEAGYNVDEGKLRGSSVLGTDTPLEGLSSTDPEWTMFDNSGVRPSRSIAQAFLTTETTTTITTQSTFVPVEGSFTIIALSERFELNASNELVYTGVAPALINMRGTVSLDGSTDDTIAMRAAKNGATLPESGSITQSASKGPTETGEVLSVIALMELETGDRVSMMVANETSTTDIIINAATYAVSD